MKIKLSPKITEQIPGLHYHILLISGIENKKKISSVSQLLRGTEVVVKNEQKKTAQRELLQTILDQGKFEDSMLLETYLLNAKIKKIQAGKSLEGSDTLANILNYLSIRNLWPIFAMDLDKLDGDWLIEFYEPKKGKKTPEFMVDRDTGIIAVLFPNLLGVDNAAIEAVFEQIDKNIQKYCLGEVANIFDLHAENPMADLNYQSEAEKAAISNADHSEEQEEAGKIMAEQAAEYAFSAENEALIESAVPIALQIKNLLLDAIQKVFQKSAVPLTAMDNLENELQIEIPADAAHGDYSSNVAMKLCALAQMPPRTFAEKVKAELAADSAVAKVEIMGPGFINFTLSENYLLGELHKILQLQEHYGRINLGKKQKVLVDFGSLNIAKPFGAHHFPTTVIGQTLVNIFEKAGFETVAVDFPGDWGTQFGKLLYAVHHWGEKAVIENEPMKELLKLYVRFHEEAEKAPELEEEARKEFKKLEDHDAENYAMWKWITDISRKDVQKIYQTMGVKHDVYLPESKYLDSSLSIVKEGQEKGVFTVGEEGAVIADLNEEGLGVVPLRKSDGATLYISRDLASLRDRSQLYPDAKKIIYVVDSAQSLHFKQLFAIAAKMNISKSELQHVAYGRMSFADGAMSTRKGNVIFATDVIEEALKRAEALIAEKSAELPQSERKQIAQGVALGAIKYSMINHAPESDWVFDWNKIMSFEGDSAPYLQYACARANSILRKAEKELGAVRVPQTDLFSITEEQKALEEDAIRPFEKPAEQKLLKTLIRLPEKLEIAARNCKPNVITAYLIDVAQTFNSFYASVPVIKTQRKDLLEARIKLVKASVQVLRNGLKWLGIASFDRM